MPRAPPVRKSKRKPKKKVGDDGSLTPAKAPAKKGAQKKTTKKVTPPKKPKDDGLNVPEDPEMMGRLIADLIARKKLAEDKAAAEAKKKDKTPQSSWMSRSPRRRIRNPRMKRITRIWMVRNRVSCRVFTSKPCNFSTRTRLRKTLPRLNRCGFWLSDLRLRKMKKERKQNWLRRKKMRQEKSKTGESIAASG